MRIDVITIFPKMLEPVLGESIIKKAQEKKVVEINIVDLRFFSKDKHRKVDDKPFGGGPGMVMGPEPFFEAVNYIRRKTKDHRLKTRTILLSPRGKKLDQALALKLSKYEHVVLLCGHSMAILSSPILYSLTESLNKDMLRFFLAMSESWAIARERA